MNKKIDGCNHQRIDDFLNSPSAALDDPQLFDHLDSCADCREQIELRAAERECWLNAVELLKPTEFDHASSADYSAATLGHRRTSQPVAIQSVIDMLAPTDDPNRIGRLGGYEISGIVGIGGMGVVLKAIDPALDRVVAIKVMAPHLANNATARRRFSREAKAAAAVLHPNVIPIHSVSSDAAGPYLVMAYIRGGSLQKRLDREGPLSTVEILRIGSQVAAGLAAAHEQGLIHRDIKPENILLEEGVERVTLTDFGLARAVDDTSVTREGTIAGTPQYMSPEQARGEPVDQRSDLFSLGSVLYTLCTGRPPFRAESSYGVMRRISDERATPIRELNPDIPTWLVGIIEKLMSKEKDQRFDFASEVRELLEACLSHVQQPTTVNLPAQLSTKKNRTIGKHLFLNLSSRSIGVLSMLSLLTAIVLGILIFPGASELPPRANDVDTEILGHGYARKGDFIFFDGQRIDQAGKNDIDDFARFTELELRLCADVDAASFKALSDEYSKDKNKVYYKWISPGRFWVVELPQADVASFEVLGFNFAKDSKNVWWYGRPLPEVDPLTVVLVNDGFVWKDATNVWYQHKIIPGADAKTFRHLEQAFYRDANQVYWSDSRLNGANPDAFRTFGDDSPFGADRLGVWKGTTQIVGLDAATFEAVHQSVYKDKNGVYANGHPIENADPQTFRKVADLDQNFTALLADEDHYYVFLPFRGEIYLVTPTTDSLKVKRQIWPTGTTQHPTPKVDPIAISTAEIVDAGWRKQKVISNLASEATQLLEDQETYLLNLYKPQFTKAWGLLRNGQNQESSVAENVSEAQPAEENPASEAWRTDTTLREPSAEITALAKALIRASFQYDEQMLKEIYSPEVQLLPGNRLFQYGLEVPEKMSAFGGLVKRDNMLTALEKQAGRDPVPGSIVAQIVDMFRIEQFEVAKGEFVTEPNQPSDSQYGKLRFTIEDNDVLLKVSVPSAFRFLQLRKTDEQWKVVAEY